MFNRLPNKTENLCLPDIWQMHLYVYKISIFVDFESTFGNLLDCALNFR